MFYIHQYSCISPQQTFGQVNLETLHPPSNKQLKVIEPSYDMIPAGLLRRMGKAVRIGIGAALPLLQQNFVPDGIIIGTANAGKEDCVKFLNQMVEFDEGMLTPLNFVQSTPNAVAGQIGLLTKNNGYNITHLHQGVSFECALLDADMLLAEFPTSNYLVGAVDDISAFNYNFEDKSGWHKMEDISNKELYRSNGNGSIPGEAATMFIVNAQRENASVKVLAVDTLFTTDEMEMQERLDSFLERYLEGKSPDLLLSGENGDGRLLKYFTAAEQTVGNDCSIARYKHMSGEFPTATAMGLWLACTLLSGHPIPDHMIKKNGSATSFNTVLMYNNQKGIQHSFILLSLP